MLQAERFDVSGVYKKYFDSHDFGSKQRNERILKVIDIMIKLPLFISLTKGATILDFGCGQGYTVKQLRHQGFHAYGYDPFLDVWTDPHELHRSEGCN